MRLKHLAPLLLLASSALPALALPGEAAAVIARCGAPTADTQGTSEVTGLAQRSLTYGNIRLNFEPMSGGWSFTSGWKNHIPMNDNEVSSRMPCFREALAQVASTPKPAMDPTILQQTGVAAPVNRNNFGINNLWVIVFLVGIIAIFGVALPRGRKLFPGPKLSARPFRRPSIVIPRFRRRPRKLPVDEL